MRALTCALDRVGIEAKQQLRSESGLSMVMAKPQHLSAQLAVFKQFDDVTNSNHVILGMGLYLSDPQFPLSVM